MLHQIIQIINPKDADQARLDQVLQGTQPKHPIVLKLLLEHGQFQLTLN